VSRARIAVLISGNGSNLQALLDASASPDYPADICLVISNKPDAYGLVRAQNSNVPARVIEHSHFETREAFDAALHEALTEARIEYVCLAGFMRLLTPGFAKAWEGRMLNIHPSLLPAYKGLNTHQRVLDDGGTESGCTVHLVTPELDDGPILLQARVPVLAGDTAQTLQQRIHAEEYRLYPEALRMLVQGQQT
jgi:phosphoribosylglycinamide formyltransferase-1